MAVDHIWRISEVMLSTGGDNTAQFVELVDSPESNPNSPYSLEVYDTDAQLVGTVTLGGPASNATIYYVSTASADTALGTNGETELDVALPSPGQVCFVRANGQKIHCLAWGCVNSVVPGNVTRVPTPPDGQSVQRQGTSNTYNLAAPTAQNTTNASGTEEVACATDVPDASPPGTPDADPGNPGGPDAGGGGGGDDEGGCCSTTNVSGKTAAGGFLLVLCVLIAIRPRRRRG